MKNMFTVKKITSAAILTALATVSTLLFKLVPMGPLPFLRFSLTPSLIIFSSLTLGPVLGAVVGAASDLIPAVVAPTGTGIINPYITIVYALLGIAPWALEFLTKKIRSSLRKPYFFYAANTLVFVAVAIPMFVTDAFDGWFKDNALTARIIVLIVLLLAACACSYLVTTTNKNYEKNLLETSKFPSPNEIAIIALVCEFFVMLLGKTTAFILFIPGLNFWLIFYMIFIGFPVNVAISTLATYWMIQFEDKHLHLVSREND